MGKVQRSMVLASFLVAGCATSAVAPRHYPDIDMNQAAAAVAVVQVRPGKHLPELEPCTKPGVICLHSPFWFHAAVVELVYGNLPAKHLKVSTLSHYGMGGYENANAPWLVSLATDGSNVVMPLYASDELVRRKDGTLFLIVRYPQDPLWLPCSVAALREELRERDFPKDLSLPFDAYEVRDFPDLYRITRNSAFPRYGINVVRMREHLGQIKPGATTMECDQNLDESHET